jgi:hypothetical protein
MLRARELHIQKKHIFCGDIWVKDPKVLGKTNEYFTFAYKIKFQ